MAIGHDFRLGKTLFWGWTSFKGLNLILEQPAFTRERRRAILYSSSRLIPKEKMGKRQTFLNYDTRSSSSAPLCLFWPVPAKKYFRLEEMNKYINVKRELPPRRRVPLLLHSSDFSQSEKKCGRWQLAPSASRDDRVVYPRNATDPFLVFVLQCAAVVLVDVLVVLPRIYFRNHGKQQLSRTYVRTYIYIYIMFFCHEELTSRSLVNE